MSHESHNCSPAGAGRTLGGSPHAMVMTAFLIMAVMVGAACGQVIRVMLPQCQPYCRFDQSGSPEGRIVDFLDTAAARNGWTLQYIAPPSGIWFSVVESAASSGAADLFPVSDPERLKPGPCLTVLKTPLFEEKARIVTRTKSIQQFSDLFGLAVGISDHCFFGPSFLSSINNLRVKIKPVRYSGFREMAADFDKGVIDACLVTRKVAEEFYSGPQYYSSPAMMVPGCIGFAFRSGIGADIQEGLEREIVLRCADRGKRSGSSGSFYGSGSFLFRLLFFLLGILTGLAWAGPRRESDRSADVFQPRKASSFNDNGIELNSPSGAADLQRPWHDSGRAEARARSIVENLHAGVIVFDPATGMLDEANSEAGRLLGINPGTKVSIYDLLPDMKRLIAPGEGGRINAAPLELCLETGKKKSWLLARSGPIGDGNRVETTITDISERKILEGRLTRAVKRLRSANMDLKSVDDLRNNLISNISHELRTPMVAVKGYTELIHSEMSGPLNEIQKNQLGICLRGIERLLSLIENMLAYARLERNIAVLEPECFDLSDLLAKVCDSFEVRAESRGLTIIRAFKEGSMPIVADPKRLELLFFNLLDNAVKFANRKSEIRIAAGVTRIGRYRVALTNSGPEIPETERQKVFIGLYQIDGSSTRNHSGAGIGLAISKKIARLHGGTIRLGSPSPGKTRVTALLPKFLDNGIKPVYNGSTGANRPSAESMLPMPTLPESFPVLIVDDDREVLNYLEALLSEEQLMILTASSSAEAFEILRSHSVGVILLDIALKSDNGIDICRSLKSGKEFSGIPVIMITADSNSDLIDKGYKAGASAFLGKPFSTAGIVKLLKDVRG